MVNKPNIKELKLKLGLGIKFWLLFNDKNILGSGWANLLENIDKNKNGSLIQAARACTHKKNKGYSYKYAWNILKRIEERTGFPPVETGKGGPGGGGWVKLNDWGLYLLNTYQDCRKEIEKIEKNLGEAIKIN